MKQLLIKYGNIVLTTTTGRRVRYHLCLLLLVHQTGYIVNLSDFYSYRLIGKLTAFLQLQEFSLRQPTVASSTSAARRKWNWPRSVDAITPTLIYWSSLYLLALSIHNKQTTKEAGKPKKCKKKCRLWQKGRLSVKIYRLWQKDRFSVFGRTSIAKVWGGC
jgi:hypothetical protein